MCRFFQTIQTGRIESGRRLAAGGEGKIFDVVDRPDLVVKVYHNPISPEKAEKLKALSQRGTERLLGIAAWPVDVLLDEESGDVAGILMRRITDAEEVHSLHSPRSRLQKFPEASWAFLIYTAANIARAVSVIHDHDLVIGDLNPKNILVTRQATIHLLDCDSFQVRAADRTWRCEMGFPEYTPPELQGLAFKDFDRSKEHDYFGLAVVIFQLLFIGRHPFSGRFLGAGETTLNDAIRERRFAFGADAGKRRMQQPPATLPLEAVPAPMRELFRRAFLSENANDRPAPSDWIEPLEALGQSLQVCTLHNGHHYFAELTACPWCTIEKQAPTLRLFNFALAGADGKRPPFRLHEIWNEINSVQVADAPPPVALLDIAFRLPPEAEAIEEKRSKRMVLGFGAAVILGFSAGLFNELMFSISLLVAAASTVRKIADVELFESKRMPTIFPQTNSNTADPALREFYLTKLNAERKVEAIEEQWKRAAGSSSAFVAKRRELEAQRSDYERLSAHREERLRRLFKSAPERIDEDRVTIEKEFDATRNRLEYDLMSGVYYLRRAKEEIERQRSQIEPRLAAARRELAIAEKTLDYAGRRNPGWLLMLTLILACVLGMSVSTSMKLNEWFDKVPQAAPAASNSSTSSPEAPVRSAEELTFIKANDLYYEAKDLTNKGDYPGAIKKLEEALKLYPLLTDGQEQLRYNRQKLEEYIGRLPQLDVRPNKDFNLLPYYYVGLKYLAEQNWDHARKSFQLALQAKQSAERSQLYPEIYYHLSLTHRGLGRDTARINELLQAEDAGKATHNQMFELATLYLCRGDTENMMAQYHYLQRRNPYLATLLDRLIEKYGVDKVVPLHRDI